jgi:hypothetical protein
VSLFGKPKVEKREDRFELKAQPDGTLGQCYFCSAGVRLGEDSAVLMVEPVPKGDPIHAVCHGACVERAKSL